MATYIMLINYTQQGIESIKESPERLDRAKELLQSLGGEVREFYLTMGIWSYSSIGRVRFDRPIGAATVLAKKLPKEMGRNDGL